MVVPILPMTNLSHREAVGLLKVAQPGFESWQLPVEPSCSPLLLHSFHFVSQVTESGAARGCQEPGSAPV